MRLPDFLVIGAPKAGTTALHHYLRQHPQIFLNPLKDSHFFLFDGKPPLMHGPSDGLRQAEMIHSFEDYRRLFAKADDAATVGEVCIRYLDSPVAPERIARRLANVRLIVILRQPVERAWSHFRMYRGNGSEPCADFTRALADERQGLRDDWYRGRYFHLGLYHQHLLPWFERFGQDRILVLLYDDLVRDPGTLLHQVFTFVGVDPAFTPDTSRPYNVTGEIANPLVRRLWSSTRSLRSRTARYVPLAWRGRLSGLIAGARVKPGTKARLSPPVYRALLNDYREDLVQLQALIGRDLSDWLMVPDDST